MKEMMKWVKMESAPIAVSSLLLILVIWGTETNGALFSKGPIETAFLSPRSEMQEAPISNVESERVKKSQDLKLALQAFHELNKIVHSFTLFIQIESEDWPEDLKSKSEKFMEFAHGIAAESRSYHWVALGKADLHKTHDLMTNVLNDYKALIEEGTTLLLLLESQLPEDMRNNDYYRKAFTGRKQDFVDAKDILAEFLAGKKDDVKKVFNVNDTLNRLVRGLLPLNSFDCFKKPISERYDTSSTFIIGNERQLRQVFRNILINAVEAAPSDRKIELALSTKTKNNEVIITISDTGSGIPIDVIDRIFEPYFTTKGKEGTGLGLYISKSIIEAHGGTISVRSLQGKGTTFTITLPKATTADLVGTGSQAESYL